MLLESINFFVNNNNYNIEKLIIIKIIINIIAIIIISNNNNNSIMIVIVDKKKEYLKKNCLICNYKIQSVFYGEISMTVVLQCVLGPFQISSGLCGS